MPGELVGELLGRLLRGGQPAGLDVGGPHRLRDVDGQHHHRAVARDAHVVGRPGHRDGQQRQGARSAGWRAGAASGWAVWAQRFPAVPCWRTAGSRFCRRTAPPRTARPAPRWSRNRKNHGGGRNRTASSARAAAMSSTVFPYVAARQRTPATGGDEPHDVGDPVPVGAQRHQRRPHRRRCGPPPRGAPGRRAKSSRSCSSMVNSRVTPDSVSCRDHVADVGQFDVARSSTRRPAPRGARRWPAAGASS